jgi:hypothetical protein
MNRKRTPALALAGCQALFLGGILSLPTDTSAADMPMATDPAYPPLMAHPAPEQGAGGYGMRPGSFGMAPGQGPARYGMEPGQPPGGFRKAPGQGPAGYGMGQGQPPGGFGMAPGQGPARYGMKPGQPPGGFGMAPGQGPAGYGMGQPQAGGAQGRGPGFGRPPGGQEPGMMGPAMGGPGAAMLYSIGAMELTREQRSQLDTIREQLQTRRQELAERLRAEGEKMRKLQEEQLRLRQTLTDLQGHMMQAIMDAANRAEELLTEEQRQAMIDQGMHVMMRPAGAGGPAQPRSGIE